MANPVRSLYDGFQNFVANLQTRGDKASFDTYGDDYIPSILEVEAAYATSWFRKIVDIPPFDSVREWRNWQAEDDQIELLEAEEQRLKVRQRVLSGLTWGRLYGGAGLILGVKNTGEPAMPLDVNRVTQGGLEYIHVADRYSLIAGDLDFDPLSPSFNQPSFYTLNSGDGKSIRLHPSRVIRFIGMEPTERMAKMNAGWGDSLWRYMHRKVKNTELTENGIASLVHEAKVDVIKVPGIMLNISSAEYTENLKTRFTLASLLKSTNNMLLLDKEEEWDRKEVDFGTLPEVLNTYLAVMAGIADIPATRLLGKSPDGLNATGDSDLRNYYDMVRSRQELELRPALQTLDECLIRSALGTRPPEIGFTWVSLWQMTPREKADIDKVKADTAKVYIDGGAIPDSALATAIQNMLVEDQTYPGLDQALADAEAEGEIAPLEEEPPAPIIMGPNGAAPPNGALPAAKPPAGRTEST